MIHVYTKTKEELAKEQADYNYGAALVKGIPYKACPTYLVKRDGTRVDTKNLTESDIMTLISIDVRDWADPNGKYKQTNTSRLGTFDLLEAVKDDWKPSYEAVAQLLQMEQAYGHIMRDILGSTHTDVVGKASTIAQFQKESSGDFSKVTNEDVIGVLQQMSINEKARQQQSGMHR